jgi:hypothetical protein
MKYPAALLLLAAGLALPAGCRKNESTATAGDAPRAPKDFVQTDDTTPGQRPWLEFGREVMVTLAARDYAKFHSQLSSHARARMSVNQFDPADDDAVFADNERKPRQHVTAPQFLELMARVERRHGAPARPLDLHLHSAEPHILAGKPKEAGDSLDIMFAIGNMPASVPVAMRRASLRGQLAVELSPAQLAEAAKAYETTPAELAKDPDFKPYFDVKLVLVEENGRLCIGYFEFLPPSMMD